MRKLPRPCLQCDRLHLNTTRCPTHKHSEGKRSGAYADPTYKRNRKHLMAEHLRTHGYKCPGAPDLDHPPHPCTDLTADHIIPIAEGGTHALSNLRVLCKSANSARNGRPT